MKYINQDFRQKFLIMHYTALHNDASVRVLTQQEVSAHYLVQDVDDDQIDLLVSEHNRAWHAGVSFWNGRTNINDSSIKDERFFDDFKAFLKRKICIMH